MGERIPAATVEERWGSAEALLAAAIPIRPAGEALCDLARVWRDRLRARVVVVGMLGASERECFVARADASGVRNLPITPATSGEGRGESLQSKLLAASGEGGADQWIPLAESGTVIGGVLLWAAPGVELAPCPGEWATTTARLMTLVRTYDRRLLHDKLEAMAEFAAGAGHEINNPLGSIVIASQRLLRDETDPERRRLLSKIGGQALRVRDMIGDAMLFARPPEPQFEELDLGEETERVIGRFADRISEKGIDLQTELLSRVSIRADRTQLAVVVSELLRNAINAVEDGGRIVVEVATRDCGEQMIAVLTVRDDGKGLTCEERAHLFDPFFSGRQAGRGLGFGLSKAWRIVTNHGGEISVTESEDAGLTFTVEWPT